MRISVTVVPNARAARIVSVGEGRFRIAVTAPARDGRANAAAVAALAEYFRVARTRVRILRGAGSRQKLVEID